MSVLVGATCTIKPEAANAKVYFDTDVYGDKELKIATVNKIKQKLRNAISQDIQLAPTLLQLSINDALGYDAVTTDGGPDGSIRLELDRDGNKPLARAVEVLEGIKNELLRTNTVNLADLISFAGGEVLETVGCPRTTVQVGRFEAKVANVKVKVPYWDKVAATGGGDLIECFYSAGLDPKDICLLLGSLGEVKRIVAETVASNNKKKGEDSDDDDEEEDSWQTAVPSTFGERTEIYGERMGKHDFGTAYLSQLLKAKKAQPGDYPGQALLSDSKVMAQVAKYAASESAFKQDVPIAYNKLTNLGQAFTTRNS